MARLHGNWHAVNKVVKVAPIQSTQDNSNGLKLYCLSRGGRQWCYALTTCEARDEGQQQR